MTREDIKNGQKDEVRQILLESPFSISKNNGYLKPDRSNYTPKPEKNNIPGLNIVDSEDSMDWGFCDGEFSNGVPFRAELYQIGDMLGLAVMTCKNGIEEADVDYFKKLLINDKIVKVLDKDVCSFRLDDKLIDANGNKLWRTQIYMADEDGVYADVKLNLKRYEKQK